MSNKPSDYIKQHLKYSGKYVGGQSYENRKPLMSKARRKVLNLLEFCLELEPDMPSVATLFYILQGEDIVSWTDEEMCVILESRANDLLKERQVK